MNCLSITRNKCWVAAGITAAAGTGMTIGGACMVGAGAVGGVAVLVSGIALLAIGLVGLAYLRCTPVVTHAVLTFNERNVGQNRTVRLTNPQPGGSTANVSVVRELDSTTPTPICRIMVSDGENQVETQWPCRTPTTMSISWAPRHPNTLVISSGGEDAHCDPIDFDGEFNGWLPSDSPNSQHANSGTWSKFFVKVVNANGYKCASRVKHLSEPMNELKAVAKIGNMVKRLNSTQQEELLTLPIIMGEYSTSQGVIMLQVRKTPEEIVTQYVAFSEQSRFNVHELGADPYAYMTSSTKFSSSPLFSIMNQTITTALPPTQSMPNGLTPQITRLVTEYCIDQFPKWVTQPRSAPKAKASASVEEITEQSAATARSNPSTNTAQTPLVSHRSTVAPTRGLDDPAPPSRQPTSSARPLTPDELLLKSNPLLQGSIAWRTGNNLPSVEAQEEEEEESNQPPLSVPGNLSLATL